MREIYDALSIDCRILAAMGARTLIDLMLTDMLSDIGGFERKLAQAVKDGMITPLQETVITTAVEAGHAASHR